MRCGLLGRHLGHSYSPQIHRALADYPYELFPIEPDAVEDFLKNGNFTGINVTIPYKKAVIPYCAELTPIAKQLGAVNTIVRKPDGSLVGHNTDYFGFSSMVARTGLTLSGKKVLVLGSGGASATAVAVLKKLGAAIVVISRNGENHYGNLDKHADASAIVNATPVGMYPDTGVAPVNLAAFPNLEGVLDIVYNPARTQLLLDAEKRGLVTENGLWMLVAQAKEAAQWFSGQPIDDMKIEEIYRKLRMQMENIVLIGMPGCGKSTVAAHLGHTLGRKVVDADAQIAELAGCTIPEIFAQGGEEAFRKLETQVLADLGKQSGLILATGGGCVTRQENYPLLHQNGRIFWLQRDLDVLPTQGRPLSQAGRLSDMYRVRAPLYEAFADHIVNNDYPVETTVAEIISYLK